MSLLPDVVKTLPLLERAVVALERIADALEAPKRASCKGCKDCGRDA